MDISGIILAGGKSSRMGKDKALLEIGGLTMLERVARVLSRVCSEIIVAGGNNTGSSFPGFKTVPDIHSGCGPLCGLHAGLTAAKNNFSFVLPCDLPFPNEKLIKRIIDSYEEGYDAIILKTGQYLEPLFSLYGKAYIRAAESCINKGIYKVTAPLSLIRWKKVTVTPGELPGLDKSLINVNTPEDYEEAKKVNN
ncbi:MAG: molybdenum cofactor guanylyltransferase [Bacillota bacterium]